MTRAQIKKLWPNLGEETDGGYVIGCAVFCCNCAVEVKDEQGRVVVWFNEVQGEYQDSAEDLPEWRREGVPVNAKVFPQGYDEVSPIGSYGETDSPTHCEGCGVLIRENLTSDGVEYVKEYCRKSRSKVARLYRETYRWALA